MRNQTISGIKLYNPERNFPELSKESSFTSKTVFAIFENGQISTAIYDYDIESWLFDSDTSIESNKYSKFMWFECPVNSNDVNW